MPTLTHLFRRTVLVAAFALCFLRAAAADGSDLGQSAGSILVPAGASKSEVKNAITSALVARGWTVQSSTDDRVVGYLKHRSNEATLTLVYDESKIDLFCVGWQINKNTGAHEKPEQPTGWLKYLRADIPKILGAGGRK